MHNKVALIGAGAMGSAIGQRLLETKNDVRVFDLDAERVATLKNLGAVACESAASAASEADFVIFSLNSARIVEIAAFGEQGAAIQSRAGTVFIDMSSIDPQSTQQFSQQARDLGLGWVDCPLSGGAPKALLGELTLMAGGDENDVTKAIRCLDCVASNITHMGPSGAGQTTKIINQVLCGLGFMAVAEATQLAMDAGVDPAKIPIALKGGRADSSLLQEYMPRYANRDFTRTGRIENMVKDLAFAQDLSSQTNTSMPMTALCMEIHKLMVAAGYGNEDQATLIDFFKGQQKEKNA